MDLTHARMVATFKEGATVYDTGHPSTMTDLATSLAFCWTEVYINSSRAESALEWLRANVIGLTRVQDVHVNSPMWKETRGDVPDIGAPQPRTRIAPPDHTANCDAVRFNGNQPCTCGEDERWSKDAATS